MRLSSIPAQGLQPMGKVDHINLPVLFHAHAHHKGPGSVHAHGKGARGPPGQGQRQLGAGQHAPWGAGAQHAPQHRPPLPALTQLHIRLHRPQKAPHGGHGVHIQGGVGGEGGGRLLLLLLLLPLPLLPLLLCPRPPRAAAPALQVSHLGGFCSNSSIQGGKGWGEGARGGGGGAGAPTTTPVGLYWWW